MGSDSGGSSDVDMEIDYASDRSSNSHLGSFVVADFSSANML